MPLDERVLDTIDALYEAALDETRWHGVLHKLADLTGSQGATFWVLDGSDQPRLPTFSYVNLDPQLIEECLAGMAEHDPTVQYLVRHPTLPIVHDSMFITERDKDRHLYYDWHHRFSDTRFRLVSRMSPASAVQAGVALLRARSAGRRRHSDAVPLGQAALPGPGGTPVRTPSRPVGAAARSVDRDCRSGRASAARH